MARMRKRARRSAPAKKARASLRMARVDNAIHRFKRRYQALVVSGSPAFTPYNNGFVVSLSNVVNASEFTNLFDQYCITYVKFAFYLEVSPDAQGGSASVWPKLYYSKDQNDATPPTLQELRERSGTQVRVMGPNRPVTVGWRPNILTEAYKTALTTGYAPKWSQWISTVDSTVPHYGLKFAIDNLTNLNYSVRVEATVWFKCRGQQ